jgi:large subunit ribosomal protein L24
MRLKKGDQVVVLSGKDVGKRGTVSRVFPRDDKVIVTSSELVNVVKRHTKPRGQVMQGGIIDKEMPIHVSNVAFWCRDCGATRVGYRTAADGSKHRVCRKCGNDL